MVLRGCNALDSIQSTGRLLKRTGPHPDPTDSQIDTRQPTPPTQPLLLPDPSLLLPRTAELMASGLPPDLPPVLRSPALLVQPPEDAQDDIIDLDLDRPSSRASTCSSHNNNNNWNDIDHAFLSPDFVVSPRRPSSRMSDFASAEGAVAAAVAITPASPAGGPFNFQTQTMSTSPVKSVCCLPVMQITISKTPASG